MGPANVTTAEYLLDTHVIIWWMLDKKTLPKSVTDILTDENNSLYFSCISLAEIALKNRIGKFLMDIPFADFLVDFGNLKGFSMYNITPDHLVVFNKIKPIPKHKDPFDHILISQAIADNLCLISADDRMPFYEKQGLKLKAFKRPE